MKGAFEHTHTEEPLVKRVLRKPALSALLFAPLISAALFAPSTAIAAEDSAPSQEGAVVEGTLVLCDDPFSLDAGPSADTASMPAGEIAFDSASTSENVQQTQDDSYMIADSEAPNKEISAPSAGLNEAEPLQCGITESISENASEPTVSETPSESGALITNGFGLHTTAITKTSAVNGLKNAIGKPDSGSAAEGDIVMYESHEADLIFTASPGGLIASGTSDDAGSTDKKAQIKEHYADSLRGSSQGATAYADSGYHFVHWYDVTNDRVVSTSPSYAPYRPDGGWPISWTIQAVFAPDVYVIVLDPNGGIAGGGGGSSGEIRIEVALGGAFQLPINGSNTLSYEKAGSVFTGWDVVAHPSAGGASGSYHLEDGQVIDSKIEQDLINRGILVIDWTKGYAPEVKLYAQWLAGQVSISYNASTGGAITSATNPDASGADRFEEILDEHSGVHLGGTSAVGPGGARAIADAHYHFAGWRASGSSVQMSNEESGNASLSSDVVKRLTYYSDGEGEYKYHQIRFDATFALNTYIVKYGSNGGLGSASAQSVTYGDSITAASSGFTRDGYELTGWNSSSTGGGVSVALGSTIDSAVMDELVSAGQLANRNNATTTLYAQWRKIAVSDSNEWQGGEEQPVVPIPDVTPTPSPDNEANEPVNGGNGSSSSGSGASSETAGWTFEPMGFVAVVDRVAPLASNVAASVEPVANSAIPEEKPGLLASKRANGSKNSLVVSSTSSNGTSSVGGTSQNFFDRLMTPEGMQETGMSVAAVTTVTALMGLVGVGASLAGAAVVGAATIGTAGAIGLTSAADLAADLAAAGAAGAAAGANRRRKDQDEEGEEVNDDES